MTDVYHDFRANLFFKAGLYEKVPFAPDAGGVWAVGARNDGMCLSCRRESTFAIADRRVVVNGSSTALPGSPTFRSGISVIEMVCSRNPDHVHVFVVLSGPKWMMKVGQWPSVADLGLTTLRRFDAVLGDSDRQELAKAIGLHAHGVGVGSFVYLRRILERLISDSETRRGIGPSSHTRMLDRIRALKGDIPSFLTENPVLYSLLSLGIHELSEDDCLEAFPVVKSAIDEILEEKLAQKLRDKAREQSQKQLGALGQRFSRKSDDAKPS